MEGFEKFEIFSHYESVNLTLNRQKGSECALYLRTASTHQGWGGGGREGGRGGVVRRFRRAMSSLALESFRREFRFAIELRSA